MTKAKETKKIKVTLKKSAIAFPQDQKATVKALGLRKINSFNIIEDNAATRGMVNKVSHLVSVEEV